MSRANKDREREYQAGYYLRNKATIIANTLKNRRGYAKKLAAYKTDNPCMDCGNTFPPCAMDFDHREPSQKVKGIGLISSWPAMLKEIEKCDLVCSNCHRIRTYMGP